MPSYFVFIYILIFVFIINNMLTQYSPIHLLDYGNDSEMDGKSLQMKVYCMKVMLEAGADTSLEYSLDIHRSMTAFVDAVHSSSLVNMAIFILV
jgi:hypothetical protein